MYGNTGYDRYLEYHFRKTGGFYTTLFHAIEQADSGNLDRLARGFPSEVAAYRTWVYVGPEVFRVQVTPGHPLLADLDVEMEAEAP